MATTENENMIVTENIELKAPKGDAFYDISYVAENNEILDKEIKKSNEHIDNLENPHKVTAKQVGLGNVPNVATNDQAPTYTEASTLATLTSGEKLSIAFGKIKCAITRLIDHIANTTMHITANERAAWNAKASTAVVSTSANGLCPKRGGTTTKFLRDDGTWAVPPNTTYGTATTSSAGLMSAAMVTKLNGIATGATKNTVDSALSSTSTNPIQNKVVNAALEEINSNLTNNLLLSTTEHRVGTWIDGKPLYSITQDNNNTTKGTISAFAHNIKNVDNIFIDLQHSYFKFANNINAVPISLSVTDNAISQAYFNIFLNVDRTNYKYFAGSASSSTGYVITFLYTKTMD